ncbi:class I SAM-dependent methyltransferase [Virgibacillus sp. AGTR]|uniref:tRNA (adenine(22)-N(1))-methyltransferase n=1 Tax=Virgibacillus sp. AGTR TaxID=2812055 RepID=UPI001962FCEB|nr:class I SAM-dependent methyltransferase [Virgibacillus sp. AGTR]MCC2251010.1 class I SAM-dependent methyltransferase [Virgibacillus sp. AGTR]QRZ17436.1 SAM-dependent methyltransferase [Virgibacillus sp. AGTR]
MTQFNISKRLKRVASFLPKRAYFADIGSDHAYLPCFVCQKDKTAKAIAGEVNEGPFQSAKDTVRHFELGDRVDVRLGNGLEVLEAKEAKQIVIAGMGGTLITTILNEGKAKLEYTEQIIAQPNVDARSVRKWLINNGYGIADEDLIEENDHFYEIISATRSSNDTSIHDKLDTKQLLFGPILLQKKPEAFYRKWRFEANKLERIIKQMKLAKDSNNRKKISLFEKEKDWMEEVTNETTDHDE